MNCNIWNAETNKTTSTYVKVSECTNLMTQQTQKNDAYQKSHDEQQKQLTEQYDQNKQDLMQACSNIDKAWQEYKQNFYENEYNNFSSSYEAVQYLRSKRDTYQQQANSAGCTIYLSV